MAAKNHSTATEKLVKKQFIAETAEIDESAKHISKAEHHIEISNAYGVGACSANRISTMIDAAIVIAKAPGDAGTQIQLLAKLLKEAQRLSEDLAGMLESERDCQLMYAEREGK